MKDDHSDKIAKLDPNATIQNWEKFREKSQRRQEKKLARPVSDELPHFRRQQRWQLTWRLVVIILIFGSLLGALTYHVSPLAHVGNISVSGEKLTAAQDVIDASKLSSENYVSTTWLTRNQLSEQIIKKVPALKKVTLKFTNWQQINIAVQEYTTVGFVVNNSNYRRVLSNGFVDDEVLKKPIGNFPIYSGFKQETALNRIIKLYGKMPAQIQNAISEVKADPSKTNPYRIHLYMNDGNEVVADSRTVISRLKYYGSIVAQTSKKGIVDLEVGAYFVPFDEEK
ncbi:cell division protein FtsQ/DivIB [Lapidilactobacillus mulanensis]|uniref:Cell division protein DivIB n=1 Tax=Lapidilactobacillus mulanensis TaxID=2485999 RepID=A0ABW4DN49_9LACO|nr:cell division protein FtsQ/DivIB [Lapidilactobacillus mulanensis]